jgi:hypothetical protein
MMRLGAGFWIPVVLVTGVANYAAKHMVQSLDDELSNVRRQTVVEQKEIHALAAAWTYLNQPELLVDLNKRFLGLAAITPKQLDRDIGDLPLRTTPTPPAETALVPQTVATMAAAEVTLPVPPLSAPVASTPTEQPVPAAQPSTSPSQAASLDSLFAQVAGGR